MIRSDLISIAAATSLLSLSAPVAASGQEVADGGWRFSIGAYVWMSGVDGDRTVPPGTAPVRFGGSGLFGGRVAPGVHAEVGKGSWSLVLDGISVGVTDELERGDPAASAEVKSELSLQSAELLVGRWLGSAGHSTGLGLLGGVRYTALREEFSDGLESTTARHGWLDPVVIARLVSRSDDGVGFVTSWQVGGFGLGSELSWGMETDLIFRWSERVDLLIGYRLRDVDYERDVGSASAFVYNGTTRGLRSRLSFNF